MVFLLSLFEGLCASARMQNAGFRAGGERLLALHAVIVLSWLAHT